MSSRFPERSPYFSALLFSQETVFSSHNKSPNFIKTNRAQKKKRHGQTNKRQKMANISHTDVDATHREYGERKITSGNRQKVLSYLVNWLDKHQNVTSVQTHQYPESRAPICLAEKAWWVQLRWRARTNTPVWHTKYVIVHKYIISSVLLLCLVPPHLRLTPRKDHARELVNLVKESGRKQEAAAKWTNRVSLFTGLAVWTCRGKNT
jgi:hypothetical protein